MNPRIKCELRKLLKIALISAQKNTFITPILVKLLVDIETLFNTDTESYTKGESFTVNYEKEN